MARKSRQAAAIQPPQSQEKRWNAGVYRRLSVEDGDDLEANSLVNQEKICRSFLLAERSVIITKIYTDNGFSGMNYARPGFQELMEDLDSGLINCVIVKDVSRFGRQYLLTSEYLQRVFPERGIRFIAVNDDYDSLKPDSSLEGLLLPFKMILNDSYAKDISKKIRSSISAKMNAGAYLPASGSIPYGYLRNPETNSFDLDEEAAGVVRRMFQMRAQGQAFNAIAVALNDEGVPSPGRLRFLRGLSQDRRFQNAAWVRGTIRKIVTDPVYLGDRIHGRVHRDRMGAKKQRRDAEQWKVIRGAHPAIVSQELFDAVQAVNLAADERRAGYSSHEKCAEDMREIFRNKLFCGDCGSRMIALKRNPRAESKRPPVIVYQCNGYQYSNRRKCFNHYTRQEDILNSIRRVLDSQLEIAADLQETIRAFRCHSMPGVGNGWGDIQRFKVKRGILEEKMERLLLDVTGGIIDKREYRELKGKYEAELAKISGEETEAAARLAETQRMAAAAQSWLEQLQRYRRMDSLNRELLDALVSKVNIYQSGRIHVELNYPDPFKAVLAYKTEGEPEVR